MVDEILVIDGSQTSRAVSRVKLAAACYAPVLAATGAEGIAAAAHIRPGIILLDTNLPDMSALDVLRRLRSDPRSRTIPVIVTGAEDAALRVQLLRAGAEDCLARPMDDTLLLARIRALLRMRPSAEEVTPLGMAEEAEPFEGPPLIGLVTERGDLAQRWQMALTGTGRHRTLALTREEALSDARCPPDVYLVDGDLGGPGAGLRFLSDLRSRMATRAIPVCVVQPRFTAEAAAMAFDIGANDVVPARFDPAELTLRLAALSRLKKRMERRRASVEDGLRMAMVDPLTGLYNRRFAMPQLEAMAERAVTEVADMAILMLDLDHFKSINDRWGHPVGDAVLVEVARRLASNLRPSDLIARIGGEEFLIALPDLHLAAARGVADRLCAAVQANPIRLPSGEALEVTISIGLATRGRRGIEPVADTVERADKALLAAKAAGRNQVTVGTCPAQGYRPH
ncbi:diguanylate cyclase [Cereibacter sp. SYSU M97828]|nr:diguanylate cyclase [Cereibacter flavus]